MIVYRHWRQLHCACIFGRKGYNERMFTVMVEKEFEAAHQLTLLDGQVEPLHTHQWKVCAGVAVEHLDAMGLVMDFHLLEKYLADIIGQWHGKQLENLAGFGMVNTSAENVARTIYQRLAGLIMPPAVLCWVEVTEAPGCRVRYEA